MKADHRNFNGLPYHILQCLLTQQKIGTDIFALIRMAFSITLCLISDQRSIQKGILTHTVVVDKAMVTKFCEMLYQILEECKYPNLTSVTFERNTMDIAVNGKRKKSDGKGYAAYLNTAMVIGFAKYLKEYAEYAPGLVVADSPILSLKEKDNQRASESMRAGLFEYIANKTEGIQVIVAENEIPNIDYKDTRIIRFTKEPHNGRYGFLIDVVE